MMGMVCKEGLCSGGDGFMVDCGGEMMSCVNLWRNLWKMYGWRFGAIFRSKIYEAHLLNWQSCSIYM